MSLPVKKDERRGLPSASSIERYDNCPGAFLLEKQVPPEEVVQSEDADRGTRIHDANEKGDVSALALTEADLVQKVRETEERIYTQWKDDFNLKEAEIEIIRERRWWLTKSGARLCSAKMDFVALAEKKRIALILDLKSGRKEVTPAPSNKQLRTSAVILTANYNLSNVRVGIVAPFQKTQPLAVYSAMDLFKAWEQLEKTLEKANDPKAARNPGTWCEFCAAKHICPEASKVVDDVAKLSGMKWSALPPAQKRVLWEKGKVVSKIIEQIEKNVAAELKADPNAIPGLEKRPDFTVRDFTDLTMVYDVLHKHFNVAPNDFTDLCSCSVGLLTDFIRQHQAMNQKQADAWVNKYLGPFMQHLPREGRVLRRKEEAKSV